MLRSAPDGVFYLVSRFVNFSKLRGTLFFFFNTQTSACSQLPKWKKKKKREKERKSWVCGTSWHHNEAVVNYTMRPSRMKHQREVGGWRDGGVKARGCRQQRKTLTKIERGLEYFKNPEGNVRDILMIIIPAFWFGYLEDLYRLGKTKKQNLQCLSCV